MSAEPLPILPDGYEPPPGWKRIRLLGGSHDGTVCWAQRPPRRIKVAQGGDAYVRVAEGFYVWHEPGAPEPLDRPEMTTEQLGLA